jgi:RNA polymerase sigma-70 factor (ECF subfamily)
MLMEAVQAGERRALGELYERFASRAYRTALSVCHDRDSAQDAVQDAFVSMWSARATYRPALGSVAGWAMSIVRYRAVYLAQRRTLAAGRDERADLLEAQAARDDVPVDFAERSDAEQLEEFLKQLPRAQREVIRLGFFEGLTHVQIARRLALPPGTVKGRMRLGLTKLRSELDASSPRVQLPRPSRERGT